MLAKDETFFRHKRGVYQSGDFGKRHYGHKDKPSETSINKVSDISLKHTKNGVPVKFLCRLILQLCIQYKSFLCFE